MNETVRIHTPLSDHGSLRAGDTVLLSGEIYTARDAAHRRIVELMRQGGALPFDLRGAVIYYCGPAPTPPGKVFGAAGPTTSYRMDAYTPELLAQGLAGMIGKGDRSETVRRSIVEFGAVYFAAVGGVAALLSKCVVSAEVIAWPELLSEAVQRLVVKDLPLVVAIDSRGASAFFSPETLS